MAQISRPVGYRVTLTEYERGWGGQPWDSVYFDNEAEARQYAIDYNKKYNNASSVPEWYVRADYDGPV